MLPKRCIPRRWSLRSASRTSPIGSSSQRPSSFTVVLRSSSEGRPKDLGARSSFTHIASARSSFGKLVSRGLGALSFDEESLDDEKEAERSRFVIDPDSPLSKAWLLLVLLAIAWCTFAVPYQISFLPPVVDSAMWQSLLCTDVILVLDVLVNFNHGFFDSRLDYKVLARPAIRRRYVTNIRDLSSPSFCRDLLSVLPLNSSLVDLKLRGAMRLNRLLRTPQMFALLSSIGDKMLGHNPVRGIQVSLIFALFAHWVACAWYSFGLAQGFDEDGWLPTPALAPGGDDAAPASLRYLSALYRALGLIVGVGDARNLAYGCSLHHIWLQVTRVMERMVATSITYCRRLGDAARRGLMCLPRGARPPSAPHCSLPHCLTNRTAPLPHCLTASLPHCLTASLPHCPTAPPPTGAHDGLAAALRLRHRRRHRRH